MPDPVIFVTRPIPEASLKALAGLGRLVVSAQDAPILPAELIRGASGAVALVSMLTDPVDEALLQRCISLKIVANYAVGTNNIDLEACRRRGIEVSNTPGVLTDATADLAFALLLDAARGVSSGDRVMRRGEFSGWGPLYRLGTEVSGKTLGLVGFGRIGQAMARRAQGFGMRVLYHQRHRAELELGAAYRSLDELLAESDFVSLHCPLTPQTRHLIGGRELAAMPRGSYLINTARGPVLDETALVESLRSGHLAGAGLDVFEEEPKMAPGLAELEQVVLAPHLGSATRETREAMGQRVVENIRAVFEGRTPPDSVLK